MGFGVATAMATQEYQGCAATMLKDAEAYYGWTALFPTEGWYDWPFVVLPYLNIVTMFFFGFDYDWSPSDTSHPIVPHFTVGQNEKSGDTRWQPLFGQK